jgi:hypothetical protein
MESGGLTTPRSGPQDVGSKLCLEWSANATRTCIFVGVCLVAAVSAGAKSWRFSVRPSTITRGGTLKIRTTSRARTCRLTVHIGSVDYRGRMSGRRGKDFTIPPDAQQYPILNGRPVPTAVWRTPSGKIRLFASSLEGDPHVDVAAVPNADNSAAVWFARCDWPVWVNVAKDQQETSGVPANPTLDFMWQNLPNYPGFGAVAMPDHGQSV